MSLEQDVAALKAQVRNLTLEVNALKQCCETNKLYFREQPTSYFDGDAPDLNTIFPTPSVKDAKGILIMYDAVLYCIYENEWVIFKVTSGGTHI